MDRRSDGGRHLVEWDPCLLRLPHQPPDEPVALPERDASFDQEIREVGGAHRRIERRSHSLGIDGECVERSRHRREHHGQRVARVEQQRFVFLKVLLVARRNPLERREQRDQVTKEASGLAARQLEDVRVPLLWHEARASTKCV